MAMLLKALHLLWPYLRMAIFKDRTIREVYAENKPITFMLVLVFTMLFAIIALLQNLVDIKNNLKHYKEIAATVSECRCSPSLDGVRLEDILKRITR